MLQLIGLYMKMFLQIKVQCHSSFKNVLLLKKKKSSYLKKI